jgi:hypothetical protein
LQGGLSFQFKRRYATAAFGHRVFSLLRSNGVVGEKQNAETPREHDRDLIVAGKPNKLLVTENGYQRVNAFTLDLN